MIRLQILNLSDHPKVVQNWLKLPHVSKWWGDPTERLKQFSTTPPSNHALIVKNSAPVGYIRWEKPSSGALESAGLSDILEGSIDIDIFIGDLSQIGCGIGPKALELLFDHLRVTTDAPMIDLCSSIHNHYAHAAFLKAGCKRATEFDDPEFGKSVVFIRHLR